MWKTLVIYNITALAVLAGGIIALFIYSDIVPAGWWGWSLGGFFAVWFVISWWGALMLTPPNWKNDAASDSEEGS